MATKKAAKATKEFTIEKKRSGRYAVLGKNGKYINGADKVKILVAEGVLKQPTPKKKPEAAPSEG